MSAPDPNRDTGHHTHGPGAGHDHRHEPTHRRGLVGWISSLIHPHSHDHADSLDDALLVSKAGTRALAVSLGGLLLTALIQAVIFAASHSVGLLADTIHNFTDALTALPIGLALLISRRSPTRRYTYGYGRGEDLAGVAVVVVMAVSAGVAAWQAVDRLIHPEQVGHLPLVALAGAIGFVGNELAARYRIRVGTRIGSAALVADGHHARTDGFTSLAVVGGALGVALGWPQADPLVGLGITIAILAVLRGAARDIYRRLMDAVDPNTVAAAEHEASSIEGVQAVSDIRIRWVGHELQAQLNITVDQDLPLSSAHRIAETVRHDLIHHIARLTDVRIHVDPCGHDGIDPHRSTPALTS
jgi:cation diffusion facilitator family transporter